MTNLFNMTPDEFSEFVQTGMKSHFDYIKQMQDSINNPPPAPEPAPNDDDNDIIREVTLYRTAFMNGRVGYWGLVEAGEYIVIQYVSNPVNHYEQLAAMYWYKWDNVKTTCWGDRVEIANTLYGAGIDVTYNDDEICTFPGDNAYKYIILWGMK